MNKRKDDSEAKHKVLITVDPESPVNLRSLAADLSRMGLDDVQAFELGRVIAGEASPSCLSEIRRLPEVRSIEDDETFTAL